MDELVKTINYRIGMIESGIASDGAPITITELRQLLAEREQLKHRDKVVSFTNETLGRYVREGKEEIERLKKIVHGALNG